MIELFWLTLVAFLGVVAVRRAYIRHFRVEKPYHNPLLNSLIVSNSPPPLGTGREEMLN